jgi:peroxiredoxin
MAQQTQTTTLRKGNVIPDFTLESTAGTTISNRAFYMRRNLAIVFTTSNDPDAWRVWLDALDAQRERIDAEAGHALAIAQAETPLSEVFPTLFDRDGAVRERFGLAGDRGAVVIIDRYGVVFHVTEGQPGSDLLPAEEIPGWLEFIACRCS